MEIAISNSILRHPNVVQSKNVAAKRCTVVHKACLDVIRRNHFRIHNLQNSSDILTDPVSFFSPCFISMYLQENN